MTTCAKLAPKLAPINPSADVSVLEGSIDQLVYKLYSLTEEELVEGRAG